MATPGTIPVQTKYGRNYVLTVVNTVLNQSIQISLPFTMDFDINRDNYSSTNYAKIDIYNLSAIHRRIIQIDQFAIYTNVNQLLVTLQAGYGSNSALWPVVFQGIATRAYSQRHGVDFITTIEGQDGAGAYQNAFTSLGASVAPAGTPIREVILRIMQDLQPYGVITGYVGNLEGVIQTAQSYYGPTIDLLSQLTNQNFFIDLMQANMLLTNECYPGGTTNEIVINAESGLLDTPLLEKTLVKVNTLFEPSARIGILVFLQSQTNNSYNGQAKICGIHHRGTISTAVCGDAVTTLTLIAGTFIPVSTAVGL
jgi:hypothetical protein